VETTPLCVAPAQEQHLHKRISSVHSVSTMPKTWWKFLEHVRRRTIWCWAIVLMILPSNTWSKDFMVNNFTSYSRILLVAGFPLLRINSRVKVETTPLCVAPAQEQHLHKRISSVLHAISTMPKTWWLFHFHQAQTHNMLVMYANVMVWELPFCDIIAVCVASVKG
jgi:hypothetical protein